jgi:metallophosphoesterase superfamily enzyme
MSLPEPPSQRYELLPGIVALPHGLLFMEATRSLVAADVHFAYEEAIGGILPLWSTEFALSVLLGAAERSGARELILLGDILHSSRMSDGAAAAVGAALSVLRERCLLTPIAGNHEGSSRGAALLGETFESVDRDGWHLFHGDKPLARGARNIVGHLHPSLSLARAESVPTFLCSPALVVVPALTPYSSGLSVLSTDCAQALRAFGVSPAGVRVVAATADRVFPFGTLDVLRSALQQGRRSA